MTFLKTDPRYFQILTLGVLTGLQFFGSDFGPTLEVLIVTLGSVCAFQVLFMASLRGRQSLTKQSSFSIAALTMFARNDGKIEIPDLRSALISGLSLSILLKSGSLWIYALAAFMTIASKFLIRVDDKHVFNPTNFGIVAVLLLFPYHSWVSPGQWGSSVFLGFMLACFALLVLYKIPRKDMGPMFLVIWTALLFGRALWLGDPMDIPLHQVQSGALLIFCFFMISDPKTIPDHFIGRMVFALAVAVLAFILQFSFQVREALFYALAAGSLARPAIDRLWSAARYEWNSA